MQKQVQKLRIMDARADQDSSLRAGFMCRHYLNGSCRYGSRCHYQHDWPAVPPPQICRYYQKRGCWYGEHCRYLHIPVIETEASIPSRRSSVPQLHLLGSGNSLPGRRGSEPALSQARGLIHRTPRESHNANVNPQHIRVTHRPLDQLIESGADSALGACQECNSEASQESSKSTERSGSSGSTSSGGGGGAAAEDQEETEAYLQSKDVTCGICMDKVYEKTSADERRFGILPSCNHPFCLRCIVTWRKTKDLQEEVIKGCPQCRVKSAFYVPHNYWVEGLAKEALIASFKEKCSKRKCSFFLRYGCCPFKAECLYCHDEVLKRRHSAHLLKFQTEDLELEFGVSATFFSDFRFDDNDDIFHDLHFHIAHGLGF